MKQLNLTEQEYEVVMAALSRYEHDLKTVFDEENEHITTMGCIQCELTIISDIHKKEVK